MVRAYLRLSLVQIVCPVSLVCVSDTSTGSCDLGLVPKGWFYTQVCVAIHCVLSVSQVWSLEFCVPAPAAK